MTLPRSLLFQLFFYLWTVPIMLVHVPIAPFLDAAGMRRHARFWERGILFGLKWITGLSFELRGTRPREPALFAVKHQSAFETLALHCIIEEVSVPLKYELTKVPLFGWYLMKAGSIRIERHAQASAMRKLIKDARAALESGLSVAIFPEGTRRPVGAEPDYKPGIAALYTQLKRPVVPVALNSGVFWGRRAFAKKPGVISLEFLEPIEPGLGRKAFMALLEQRLETATARLVEEASAKYGY